MRATKLFIQPQNLTPATALFLLYGLTSCAASSSTATQNVSRQTANGSFYTGTVIAVRLVNASTDTTGTLNQIMSSLGHPSIEAQASALEIVIRLSDGSVRIFAQPEQPALDGLSPGKRVVVTETTGTTIHQE
jgi:outer membrane lipoprotein SlyB